MIGNSDIDRTFIFGTVFNITLQILHFRNHVTIEINGTLELYQDPYITKQLRQIFFSIQRCKYVSHAFNVIFFLTSPKKSQISILR